MDELMLYHDAAILQMASNIAAAGYGDHLHSFSTGVLSDRQAKEIASDALKLAREICRQADTPATEHGPFPGQ